MVAYRITGRFYLRELYMVSLPPMINFTRILAKENLQRFRGRLKTASFRLSVLHVSTSLWLRPARTSEQMSFWREKCSLHFTTRQPKRPSFIPGYIANGLATTRSFTVVAVFTRTCVQISDFFFRLKIFVICTKYKSFSVSAQQKLIFIHTG